jgi:hypothetical protein
MMIAVFLAAIFFSLVARLRSLSESMSYHADQVVKARESRTTPLELWHASKAREYRAAHERIDSVAFVLLMACAVFVLLLALGRVLHWLGRPSVGSARGESTRGP